MAEEVAFPTLAVGAIETIISCAFYPTLHYGLLSCIGDIGDDDCSSTVAKKLKRSIVLDCCNKVVSSIFALITCAVGLGVFLTCGTEVVYSKRALIRHYMCLAVGYFVHDLHSMYQVHRAQVQEEGAQGGDVWGFCRRRTVMVAHHLILAFFGFPLFMFYQRGLGDCLICCVFLMEASTPFVSFRAILANLGMKSSPVYLANGLLMMFVFFCCRLLVFPYMYSLYANQLGKSLLELQYSEYPPWFCNFSMGVLLAPQVYWFALMVKGSSKVIQQRVSNNAEKKE